MQENKFISVSLTLFFFFFNFQLTGLSLNELFPLVLEKAFLLLCPTYQSRTEYLPDTVWSTLPWNHKAGNHHPTLFIFSTGEIAAIPPDWVGIRKSDVCASGKRQKLWVESREGAENNFLLFFLLMLWRKFALSVSTVGILGLLGTDV